MTTIHLHGVWANTTRRRVSRGLTSYQVWDRADGRHFVGDKTSGKRRTLTINQATARALADIYSDTDFANQCKAALDQAERAGNPNFYRG
ncbi:hypothetical protein ACQE3E_06460 [Methylomonas sp. MED-D]|uniref:hypothetical protein n=1 Tax=Methylomonas sp. MED-D TaxID=3418768 RepID=UPI003CFCC7B9